MKFHVAINGWFWDRPDTGSGQYLHKLVRLLPLTDDRVEISLVLPRRSILPVPKEVRPVYVPVPFPGNAGKFIFEQSIFPARASMVGAKIAHVPYWAPPDFCRIPVVVTIHDVIPLIMPEYRGSLLSQAYTRYVSRTARKADWIITDSESSRHDISDLLELPEERISTIYLAADRRFRELDLHTMVNLTEKYGLPDHFLLYLGGYDIRKNVSRLLKAFAMLPDELKRDYPLVLASRLPAKATPRIEDVRPLISQLRLEDSVFIAGWIDEDDKPALYRMAEAFLFPSLYEGFGLPPLEAMSVGTPVIAGNRSSLPEIVGEGGLLVNPEDLRQIMGAIRKLLTEPRIRSRLAARALRQAEKFSWKQTIDETIAVYRHLLSGRAYY